MAITHATLLGLIKLQEIDHEVYRIRRRLEDGPRLLERRGEGHRLAEERLAQGKDRVKHAKAKVAELELTLKGKEAEIQKAAAQQLQASTNQEYKALGDHQLRVKKDCDAIEDQILEAWNAVEKAEEEQKELAEQAAEQKAELDRFRGQWEKDQAEYEQELEGIAARRAEACQALPKGSLQVYERVLKAREGEAVVPAEGRVCGACRMAITPNDLARLQGGADLVSCKSCDRILYIPEIHGAAH